MVSTQSASALLVRDDEVVTGEGVALSVQPAGLMARACGALIDMVALSIGFVVTAFAVLWFIIMPFNEMGRPIESAWMTPIMIGLLVLWMLVVPMTIETLSHGRSLGKLAMGCRIVRDDGGAISARHAFVRALVGLAEIWATAGGAAIVAGLLNARSKRIGDMLAGTFSQSERRPRPKPLQLPLPPQLSDWAQVADVSRLPDRLARSIHDFFLQRAIEPAARQRLAADLARRARHYVAPIPDVDAETFLIGVSVLRRDREYRALRSRAEQLDRLAPVLFQRPNNFPDRD